MTTIGSRMLALAMISATSWANADSGSADLVNTFATTYSRMELPGQSITGGSIHGAGSVVKASGVLFREGDNFVTECIVYAKKSDAGLDLEAPCMHTDTAGDKLYYVARRKSGDMNAGGPGQQELVGGTGRFSGIRGSCTFKTEYVSATQAVSHQSCQWQR